MIPTPEHCSLDRSRLVFLSGAWGGDGLDLTVNYCPRCDVAFAFLALRGVEAPPAVLEWHRNGSRHKLRAVDQPRWWKLPPQFRKRWGADIPYQVGQFLRYRHSPGLCCPMDGCRVPILHSWQDSTGTRWRLTWCRWCALEFLFASDPDYGWEHCADLTWGEHGYELGKQYATGGAHTVSSEAIAGLPHDRPPALETT